MSNYVITILLSVVSAVLAYILKELIKENRALRAERKATEDKREEALSNGVLSLLRIQLIEYYEKYMTRESIPPYVFDNWGAMYSAYEALGGNGTIKHMNEDIREKQIGGQHENN